MGVRKDCILLRLRPRVKLPCWAVRVCVRRVKARDVGVTVTTSQTAALRYTCLDTHCLDKFQDDVAPEKRSGSDLRRQDGPTDVWVQVRG
jgi:hypothetical protein